MDWSSYTAGFLAGSMLITVIWNFFAKREHRLAMALVDQAYNQIERLQKDIKALLDMLTDEYLENNSDVFDMGVPDWITMAYSLASTKEVTELKSSITTAVVISESLLRAGEKLMREERDKQIAAQAAEEKI